MASTFDLKGTSLDSFKIGIGGPSLNRSGSDINIGSNKIITTADLPSSTVLQAKTNEVGTEILYSMPNSSATSQILAVSITPASSSNKVLLSVNVNGLDTIGGSIMKVILRRDSTTLVERRIDCSIAANLEAVNFDFLDSPNTTSAISYNIIIGSTATLNLYVNKSVSSNVQGYSSLTALEIGPGAAGGSASGEANTASNVGTGGVGIYKQKIGVNLEFKNINAGSSKVTVTNDTSNNEIDIDVSESNLTLDNLGGTLSLTKGGTGATSASAALTALGGVASSSVGAANGVASLNSSTLVPDIQISTNIARTASPTFTGTVTIPTPTAGDNTTKAASTAFVNTAITGYVTAANVGNTTAQWNASKLQGVDVNTTSPTSGQVLTYNSTSSKWEAATPSGGGSSTLATLTDTNITSPTNRQILVYNSSNSKWENKSEAVNQHPGYRSARWYTSVLLTDGLTSSTTASNTNTISYYPFYIPRRVTIDYFSFNQSATGTAGTLLRLAVYTNGASTYLPDTLAFQTSEITTSAIGQKGEAVSYTFDPGWYWGAIWSSLAIAISAETTFPGYVYYFGMSSWSATGTCYGFREPYTYVTGGSLPTTASTSSLTELTTSIPAFYFRAT